MNVQAWLDIITSVYVVVIVGAVATYSAFCFLLFLARQFRQKLRETEAD